MASINFKRTFELGENFETIKTAAFKLLADYLDDRELIRFDKQTRSVTFTSERLMPQAQSGKPRLMFLFANPHPASIQQGMFLSPNRKRRESLFWPIMEEVGFFTLPEGDRSPHWLRDVFLEDRYQAPFQYIFYCYYQFPTDLPEDLTKIFGKNICQDRIEPEAEREFRETLAASQTSLVLAFNKAVYNLVAKDKVDRYLERLQGGELIKSAVRGAEGIPLYLTYPTGWRHHKDFRRLRTANLQKIKDDVMAGKQPGQADKDRPE